MKATAIGFSQYGDIDVFETKEIDVHVNALNNMLVKVERIGLNPVDAFIRSGNMSGGKPLTRFQVLSGEVQGEIVDFDATNGLQDHIAYKLPFTLEGVKEAHTLLESSRKSGKILLIV